MGIRLENYFKDTFNVFTEEEVIMIFKKAGYVDMEEQRLENKPTNEKEVVEKAVE